MAGKIRSSFLDLLWARLFSLLSRLRQPWRWPFVATWRVIKWFLQLVHDYNGAVTALATVAIVALTVAYVSYSKKQWQVARDTLEISQRAYVTIGQKDGVVAEFVKSQNPKQTAELVVYFRNSGHLPAKLAWGTTDDFSFIFNRIGAPQQASGISYNHPFTGLPIRNINIKDGGISEYSAIQGQGTQVVTIAGDSVFAGPIATISAEDLQALPSKDIQTSKMGMFQYCDELGTDETHEFLFGYRNAASPSLNFYLVKEGRSFIESFPKPTLASPVEYLSPCETIGERQENQKKIEQYNSKALRLCRWLKLCK